MCHAPRAEDDVCAGLNRVSDTLISVFEVRPAGPVRQGFHRHDLNPGGRVLAVGQAHNPGYDASQMRSMIEVLKAIFGRGYGVVAIRYIPSMDVVNIAVAVVVDAIGGNLIGVAPKKSLQILMGSPHAVIDNGDHKGILSCAGPSDPGSVNAIQKPSAFPLRLILNLGLCLQT